MSCHQRPCKVDGCDGIARGLYITMCPHHRREYLTATRRRHLAKQVKRPVPCRGCQQPMLRQKGGQRFCSNCDATKEERERAANLARMATYRARKRAGLPSRPIGRPKGTGAGPKDIPTHVIERLLAAEDAKRLRLRYEQRRKNLEVA